MELRRQLRSQWSLGTRGTTEGKGSVARARGGYQGDPPSHDGGYLRRLQRDSDFHSAANC